MGKYYNCYNYYFEGYIYYNRLNNQDKDTFDALIHNHSKLSYQESKFFNN